MLAKYVVDVGVSIATGATYLTVDVETPIALERATFVAVATGFVVKVTTLATDGVKIPPKLNVRAELVEPLCLA